MTMFSSMHAGGMALFEINVPSPTSVLQHE